MRNFFADRLCEQYRKADGTSASSILRDALRTIPKSREATLDDFNSEKNYRWPVAHSNTVVVNESLVIDSAERFPLINFYGMNPGIINSNIMSGVFGDNSILLKIQQAVIGVIFQSAEQYAKK